MLGFDSFIQDFGNAAPNTMNTSIYRDNFRCACGQTHWFDEFIEVVCQGASMKLMVKCPDNPTYITSIKIKTFMVFKFKGFESVAGTQILNDEEAVVFNTINQYMRRR